jgi:hypothetical protein
MFALRWVNLCGDNLIESANGKQRKANSRQQTSHTEYGTAKSRQQTATKFDSRNLTADSKQQTSTVVHNDQQIEAKATRREQAL